jgi:two-component system NtrC family sensor kinase
MRWSIRTQILLTLTVVLGFGLIASYIATSNVTRGAVTDARIHQARNVTALAAERFTGVPTEGLALAETLARIRPLVEPDRLFLLGPDLAPIVDAPTQRGRFQQLVRPADLVPYNHRQMRHGIVRARTGEPLLVVLAPVTSAPSRIGRSARSVPTAVCLLAPLEGTIAEVDRIDRLYVLFMLIILAMAMLLGYVLLGRIVVQPIHDLIRSVDRVGGGEYTARIAESVATGEFSQLFRSFRRMTGQLSSDRRRIERQLSELEVANREIASTQDRLIRTEKLASVGELAAGVAHEIGNPMAVLQGYLEMLADGGLPDEVRHEYVSQMQRSVTRISGIIRELLDFARPSDDPLADGDAALAVRSALKLCGPQKRFRDLALHYDGSDEPVLVAVSTGRLEQVMLNLLFNAADASESGQRIEVGLKCEDGLVSIHVTDQGHGIDEDGLLRIFDPFFTTKDPGQGTGLGLAVCYGIIQTCGGSMDVKSAPGEGTTFTVCVPTPSAAEAAA